MMSTLSPTLWSHAFARISQRYAGHLVTMRQRPANEREPLSLLWRTPLHHLTAPEHPSKGEVTLLAGHDEHLFTISLGVIKEVQLRFNSDHELAWILFTGNDGTVTRLIFNDG